MRRNYEQAQLWDPGGRQEIRAGVAHARAMVAALDSAMPAPTPTFRPGASPAGGPAPAASAASRNLGQAPPPAKPAAAAGYRALRSATLPSAIAYPIGWGGELGGAGGDEGRSDRFVAPGAEGIAASVAVAGLALPGGAGDETFVARKVAALRGATDFRELAPRTVGGMAAVVVSFVTARAGESRIAVRAFCAGDGIGWQLTILARPDDLAGAMIVSGAMLASFEPGGGR